jgi:hypothetical protein
MIKILFNKWNDLIKLDKVLHKYFSYCGIKVKLSYPDFQKKHFRTIRSIFFRVCFLLCIKYLTKRKKDRKIER